MSSYLCQIDVNLFPRSYDGKVMGTLNFIQMELQSVDKHTGINTWVCQDACHLMKSIVASNWNSCHTCISDTECTYCESRVIWHQLCLQLITYIVPENPAYPPDVS